MLGRQNQIELTIYDVGAPVFMSNRGDTKLVSSLPGDFAQAMVDAVHRYFESPGK